MVKVRIVDDDGKFEGLFDCSKNDVSFGESGLCIHNQDCRDIINDPYYGGIMGLNFHYNCYRPFIPTTEE